jgi:hypothetical protein
MTKFSRTKGWVKRETAKGQRQRIKNTEAAIKDQKEGVERISSPFSALSHSPLSCFFAAPVPLLR